MSVSTVMHIRYRFYLSDGDGPVDVVDGHVLGLGSLALRPVLRDVVQRFLLATKPGKKITIALVFFHGEAWRGKE